MIFVILIGEDVLQQQEARQVIVGILEAIVSFGPQKGSQQCLNLVQNQNIGLWLQLQLNLHGLVSYSEILEFDYINLHNFSQTT